MPGRGPPGLHKLADYAVFPQQASDREDEIRGCGSLWQAPCQPKADNSPRADQKKKRTRGKGARRGPKRCQSALAGGQQKGQRLPQHGGLGLDAPDTPSQDAKPVNHCAVRVGADQ